MERLIHMHGLPETFDPSFLKGKEIQSIAFAAYQVNVHLDGNVWVQIEGRYKLLLGGEIIETVSAFPISQSSLLQLIGKKITDVSFIARNGDIELVLDNGYKLLIEGDTGPYESYRLFDGQGEIIV
jgi:hypothetical protein